MCPEAKPRRQLGIALARGLLFALWSITLAAAVTDAPAATPGAVPDLASYVSREEAVVVSIKVVLRGDR